jgi:secretion/DNA translocation related TadE-like protein
VTVRLGRPRRRSPPPGGGDCGVATVWAATAVAVLIGLLVAALDLAGAVAGRHRAEAAADLAALAAAGQVSRGTDAACARAAEVASRTGGRLVLCRLQGWEALVEVEATVRLALVGPATVRGRARAGPAASPRLASSRPRRLSLAPHGAAPAMRSCTRHAACGSSMRVRTAAAGSWNPIHAPRPSTPLRARPYPLTTAGPLRGHPPRATPGHPPRATPGPPGPQDPGFV